MGRSPVKGMRGVRVPEPVRREVRWAAPQTVDEFPNASWYLNRTRDVAFAEDRVPAAPLQ